MTDVTINWNQSPLRTPSTIDRDELKKRKQWLARTSFDDHELTEVDICERRQRDENEIRRREDRRREALGPIGRLEEDIAEAEEEVYRLRREDGNNLSLWEHHLLQRYNMLQQVMDEEEARWLPHEAFEALIQDAMIIELASEQMATGKPLSEKDRERLAEAVDRFRSAREAIGYA